MPEPIVSFDFSPARHPKSVWSSYLALLCAGYDISQNGSSFNAGLMPKSGCWSRAFSKRQQGIREKWLPGGCCNGWTRQVTLRWIKSTSAGSTGYNHSDFADGTRTTAFFRRTSPSPRPFSPELTRALSARVESYCVIFSSVRRRFDQLVRLIPM